MMTATFTRQAVRIWAPQVDELLTRLEGLAFIAGGAARQVVLDDAPPALDIDLFLFAADGFEPCKRVIAGMGYATDDETPSALTFRPRDLMHELPVQIIKPSRDRWSLTVGSPVEVLRHFSFTTEQFALMSDGAVIGTGAIEDTRQRRLVLNNITDPLHVAMRAMKYAGKGYHVTPADMQRLFDAWGERQ